MTVGKQKKSNRNRRAQQSENRKGLQETTIKRADKRALSKRTRSRTKATVFSKCAKSPKRASVARGATGNAMRVGEDLLRQKHAHSVNETWQYAKHCLLELPPISPVQRMHRTSLYCFLIRTLSRLKKATPGTPASRPLELLPLRRVRPVHPRFRSAATARSDFLRGKLHTVHCSASAWPAYHDLCIRWIRISCASSQLLPMRTTDNSGDSCCR